MGFVDDKNQVFRELSIINSINKDIPVVDKIRSKVNSFKSLDTPDGNLTDYLMDLLKSLVGTDQIRDEITDLITKNLPNIDRKITTKLIDLLKELFICGFNFDIPTDTSLTIKVSLLDLTDLLKIDPSSDAGSLMYQDEDVDFNHFLYNVIQNNTGTWKGILDVTFSDLTQEFTFTFNSSYLPKNILDFVGDYMGTIQILPDEDFITKIIDVLFGTVSFEVGFSEDSLIKQERVNKVIDKIMERCGEEEEEDFENESASTPSTDTFTFTSDEELEIERRATQRANGTLFIPGTFLTKVNGLTPQGFESTISFDTLKDTIDTINTSDRADKNQTITDGLETLTNEASQNGDDQDINVIKMEIYGDMVKLLPQVITNSVISPKVIVIMLLLNKIVDSGVRDYADSFDFTKTYDKFFSSVVEESKGIVIEYLYQTIKKEILKKVGEASVSIIKESIKNYRNQLLSLTGAGQFKKALDVLNKADDITNKYTNL